MLSLSAFPKDMLCITFNFISDKDLESMSHVSRLFKKIILDETLPFNYKVNFFLLETRKFSKLIVSHNLQQLWRNPEGNFYTDQFGKLELIHPMNLFSNTWKYLNNANDEIKKKVHLAAKLTLQEAYHLAVYDKEYLRVSNTVNPQEVDSSKWLDDSNFPFLPVNFVACRLAHSNQFKNLDMFTFHLFKKKIFFGYIRNDNLFESTEDYLDAQLRSRKRDLREEYYAKINTCCHGCHDLGFHQAELRAPMF